MEETHHFKELEPLRMNLISWTKITSPVSAEEEEKSREMFQRMRNIALRRICLDIRFAVVLAGDSELLKYLLDKGITNLSYKGHYMLMLATADVNFGFECARVLLDRGVSVRGKRFGQRTGVMNVMLGATKSKDPRLVPKFKRFIELLLSHGEEPRTYSLNDEMDEQYESATTLSEGTVYEEVFQAHQLIERRHWLWHARNVLVDIADKARKKTRLF